MSISDTLTVLEKVSKDLSDIVLHIQKESINNRDKQHHSSPAQQFILILNHKSQIVLDISDDIFNYSLFITRPGPVLSQIQRTTRKGCHPIKW